MGRIRRTVAIMRRLDSLLASAALLGLAIHAAPALASSDPVSVSPAESSRLELIPFTMEIVLEGDVEVPERSVVLVLPSGESSYLELDVAKDASRTTISADLVDLADGWHAISWSIEGVTAGSSRFEVVVSSGSTDPHLLEVRPSDDAPPSVTHSFPLPASELRYPPRESRIVFDRAFEVSGFSATLTRVSDGSTEQLQRLNSGRSDEALVRVPLLGPGSYRIDWSSGAGGSQGSIPFSVSGSISAPGGGNHRHSTDDMYLESFRSWFPRAAIVALAGLMLGLHRRSRRSGEADFVTHVAPRLIGGASFLSASAGVVVSVVEGLVRFHDHPLEGVLAFDQVWAFVAAAAIGVFLLVAGPDTRASSAGMSVSAALVASVAPFMQFRYGALVPLVGLLSYAALLMFFASLPDAVLEPAASRTLPVLLAAAVAASSSALLFATAQTFDLLGNFAWEWSVRWRVMLLAASVTLVWWRMPRSRSLLFIAVTFALGVLAMLGIWMPPPAPGI